MNDQRLEDALARVLPPGRLTAEQLAPLDQFHVGGLPATAQLAAAAAPAPGAVVLDVGSGLGGPARFLAATYGCRVLGIDANAAFVTTARRLTKRTQLDDVRFEVGDAYALPVADGSVDLVWLQHVAMNLFDRPRFYREIARVLRAGGRLVEHDVVSRGGPLRYPTPWAASAEESAVRSEAETRSALASAGFRERSWSIETAAARAWFASVAVASPGTPNLGLVLGPAFAEAARNLALNLEEGRADVLAAVLERSAA